MGVKSREFYGLSEKAKKNYEGIFMGKMTDDERIELQCVVERSIEAVAETWFNYLKEVYPDYEFDLVENMVHISLKRGIE